MSKKPEYQQRGYLLPNVIDPEECKCVCVPVPDDENHIRAFLGQLDYLGYWWTWEKDDLHLGKEAAQIWRGIAECVRWRMDNDCGCGGSGDLVPTNQRFNDNYELEVSYDGGLTWQDAHETDPRHNSPLFPPLPETEPSLLKCQMANSIVVEIMTHQEGDLERMETSAGLSDFMQAIIGLLIGLGIITGGLTAFLAALGAAIGSFIAHWTATEFEAAFTETVWDTLLCIVYCNQQNDGTFTNEDWNAIQTLVQTEIGGLAGEWLFNIISAMGEVGLTNAGRKGNVGTRDCDLCDCNLTWCYEWRWDSDDHPRGIWEDYTLNGAVGAFISGSGFEGSNGTTLSSGGIPIGYKGISQMAEFTPTTVTRFKVIFDYAKGAVDFAAGGAEALQLNDTTVQFNTFNNLPTTGTNVVREWTGIMEDVDTAIFVLRSSRDGTSPFSYSGSMMWKYVRLEGIGENPFAEDDNCL